MPGTPRTVDLALRRATAFADESGVQTITPARLADLEQDKSRTLYVLDVRDPAEYRVGHRKGSLSAPGGQLVLATDTWVGVHGARVVVIDDTGVRARMSAAWLRQMGHKDVFVADNALGSDTSAFLPDLAPPAPTISVETLAKFEHGTVIVDLARSIDFRAGHINHALWGVRSRLAPLISKHVSAARFVLTSPDGTLARFAFEEVRALTRAEVLVLDGGTAAWRAGGHPVTANRADPPDDSCIDFYLRAYDRNSGVEEAMNAYLTWEIDLVNEIQKDGTIAFGVSAAH